MWKTRRLTAVILSLASIVTLAAQSAEDQFGALAKTHRWFELRTSVTERSSSLLRGAVASAFNDPDTAERLLRNVIRQAPKSDAVDDAYALLSRICIRAGQYERFTALYEAWAGAMPHSATVRAERENFEKFRGRPNQI